MHAIQTFLPDPNTSVIYLKVLYDGVLDETIGVNRSTVSSSGRGQVTFRDLHGRRLIIPPLTWPFRRALVRHAKSAYDLARLSSTPHAVADQSAPTLDDWDVLYNYSKDVSPECSQVAFFNAND
jgi:hypothetical protein